jgi:cytochrome bd-type quinol oxidase subunit 2
MFAYKNTNLKTLLLSGLVFLLSVLPAQALLMPRLAYAQDTDCSNSDLKGTEYAERCGCKDGVVDRHNCGIVAYLVTFINVLSAIVGVVIVIMITIGGIQYSAARDNPQAAAAAKGKITNAILALILYLFTFAFLQWIVPGGVL